MKSVEQGLLARTEQLLVAAVEDTAPGLEVNTARLTVLEEVAAAYAGWDAHEYRTLMQGAAGEPQPNVAPWADKILSSLSEVPIPVPLALSALSREVLSTAQQRTTGAYHTDWRLAQMLAADSVPLVSTAGPWVDPACGSGMLLVGAVLHVPAGDAREEVLRNRICGADLSGHSLRGAALSLASLTTDLETASAFRGRLLQQDSLRAAELWQEVAPDGVALLIANPPWERLRASRHEVAAQRGVARHYGQRHDVEVDLTAPRAELLAYVKDVVTGTRLQGRGEHDLYKLFLELGLGMAAEDGILAMLVPAGLIRAQGTEPLRREVYALARELNISVIENRQRHFAIDTRFKFLSVVARVGDGPREPVALRVADRAGALPARPVSISRDRLESVRPDLSLPEVRSSAEWELFEKMTRRGLTVGDREGPWRPSFHRELDMTNDARHFHRPPTDESLPVIEGRHVSHFRSRAKRYLSGEGRAAKWMPQTMGRASLTPQWFINPDQLRAATRDRVGTSRIGFCDITGQTNERTLLVARLPDGVVCGNKVPTLTFPEGGPDREDLFLALANSLVVDWMLRRVVTTTVNFFLLNAVPLPPIDPLSHEAQELVKLARSVTAAERADRPDLWQVGQWRAGIDALAAALWGLTPQELELVIADFPLIDRGQPPLAGETRSTVTADCVLAAFADLSGEMHAKSRSRADNARHGGALPYVPAEYA